jgi:hypothetical protein
MEKAAGETDMDISVTLTAAELAALDAWRKNQPGAPGRPEALRRLATLALRDAGGSETIALDDLNASNDE